MFNWVDDKHRLVVVNDETFLEERSFRLTPLNVALAIGIIVMIVSLITMLVMITTPLGRLVPESKNQHIRSEINNMYQLVDSLEDAVRDRNNYIAKMRQLVFQEFEYAEDLEKKEQDNYTGDHDVSVPKKSSELQKLMENVDNEMELGNLIENTLIEETSVDAMVFVTPLRGMVSDTFAPNRSHYGTDIIAPKGEVIRATQKGTVIVSTWSADTGHMIGIQHENNVISFYKHNSTLLKKMGDIVKAGDGIAIIGNSGEMTSGPHLHFELWYRGQAVNPQHYISFK